LKRRLDINLHSLHIVNVDGCCYQTQLHQHYKKITKLKQKSKQNVSTTQIRVVLVELLLALRIIRQWLHENITKKISRLGSSLKMDPSPSLSSYHHH
jgi:hypothetical protein